jgi:hypothetical protein
MSWTGTVPRSGPSIFMDGVTDIWVVYSYMWAVTGLSPILFLCTKFKYEDEKRWIGTAPLLRLLDKHP